MWRFMEGSARAAEEIGIRATLVPYVADLPGYDYFETLESNLALLESAPRRRPTGGSARGSGSSTSSTARPRRSARAAELAEEYDTGIHTHSSESIWEVQESLKRFGRRPIEEFYNRGILGDRTRGRPLRLARRPRDRAAGPDRHERRPLPVLEHEAVVGTGADRRLPRGRHRRRPRHRRREGEQQPRPVRGDEVRLAAARRSATLDPTVGDPWDILDMATLDGARALGPRRRHRLARGRASGPTSSPSTCASCTSRRCCTARTSTSPPTSCSPPTGPTSTTCGSTGACWSTAARCCSVDAETVRHRAQAAAEELFERRRALQEATA